MRLLAVDDDDLMLLLVVHQLRLGGHTVDTAPTGSAALDRVRATAYDAVVCDWDMPGLTGPDVCRAIRAGTAGPADVRFVLLTAHTTDEARAVAAAAGADAFLTKVCPPAKLLAAVAPQPADRPAIVPA